MLFTKKSSRYNIFFTNKMSTIILKKYLIILSLIIAGVATYIFSGLREPVYDDLCYLFIFDDNNLNVQEELQRVETFDDVINSQIWHYNHVNGRAPIHIIVQTLENISGYKIFGILNAIMFVLFITLIVKYIEPRKTFLQPAIWLIVILAVQYLFPGGLGSTIGPWYSVAIAINYLWAGTLFMFYIHLWKKYHGKKIPFFKALFVGIVSLLMGWSNEAFSVPLSGAVFIYYLINIKKKRNNSDYIMSLALWIGAILLVFAPGTFERVSDNSSRGLTQIFISLIECYTSVVIIWLLMIAVIVFAIKKKLNKVNFNRNLILWLSLIIALMFSIYAHSIPHSLTFIELVSLILLITIFRDKIKSLEKKINNGFYLGVIVIYSIHIFFILYYNQERYDIYRGLEDSFKNSPDGVVKVDYPRHNILVNPFLDNIDMNFLNNDYAICYSAWKDEKQKVIRTFNSDMFEKIIEYPDSVFADVKIIPGSAGLYDTNKNYYYTPIDSTEVSDDFKIVANFDSNDFMKSSPLLRKIFYKFTGIKKQPKVLDYYIIKTRNGAFIVSWKLLSTPSSIDIVY